MKNFLRLLLELSSVKNLNAHTTKLFKSFFYHLYLFKIFNSEFKGLNLGSGNNIISGFCNIDANPYVMSDIIANTEKLKLNSGSTEIIYNSHILEHIPRAKVRKILLEWKRVLKPGGKLYISVPDLEVLFRGYLEIIPEYTVEEKRKQANLLCGIIYGGQSTKYDFHYYGYSFESLKFLLQSMGFKDIKRFNCNELGFYNINDTANTSISLNIKATK